jgi:small neutral amino acid transporter SnatA (MarC family)
MMMPDVVSLTLQWLLIFAPIGALLYANTLIPASDRTRSSISALGVAGAVVLLAVAIALAEPFIDLLEISEPNWRIAAGALLILGAARLVLLREPFRAVPLRGDDRRDSAPLAVARIAVWLANPAAAAAAMAFALHRGTTETIIAIAVAGGIVLTLLVAGPGLEARAGRPILREIARALLLGTVLVGLRLIIDGVDGI